MSNPRRAVAIIVALISLTLAGCSPISEGTLVNKSMTEEWTERVPMCYYGVRYPGIPDYPAKGSPYPCIIGYYQDQVHPATYRLDLEHNKETGWVYVNEEAYNRYKVGDFYGVSTSE